MQKQTYTASENSTRQTYENLFPLFAPLTAMGRNVSRYMVTDIRPLTNLSDARRIHYHDFLEIGYCVSGSGLYYIRGEIYPFGQGDIVIVYPDEEHDACNTYVNSSTWRFLFADTAALLADLPDREHLTQLTDRTKCRGRLCSPAEKKRILPLLQRIFDLSDEQECLPPEHPYLPLLTAGILYETERFLPEDTAAGVEVSEEMQRFAVPAVAYMMNHYASPMRMEDLCEICYVSEGHLRRVFTAVFGIPPMAFLHKIRIRHACAALESSDTSILSIAGQCGYTSLSSFNRQFRHIMQMTPSEYRQAYRKNAQ